jgi:hypothetical protein
MRFALAVLMVLIPAAVAAAALEESYYASRAAAIKKFRQPGEFDDARIKEHDIALADLLKQLRRIVGPLDLKNVVAEGKINLDTLVKGDQGFGMLDGVLHASEDDKTRIVVTTDLLLKRWLQEHRKWWRDGNVPQDVNKALQSESFYTQAISTDSAVSKYAELPIKKPAQASFAFAMLNARTQTDGPRPADNIIVSVVQGGRVYVVSAPAGASIGPIPKCDAVWQEYEKKAAAAYAAAAQFDPKEKNRPDGSKVRDQGDAAYHRCFAAQAPGDKSFPALLQQAQAIADALPSK